MSEAATDPFLDFEEELKGLLDLTADLHQRLKQQGTVLDSLTSVRDAVEQTGAALVLAAEAMKVAGGKLEPISTARVVEAMDAAASRIEGLGEKSAEGARQGLGALSDEVKQQLQTIVTGWETASSGVLDRLRTAEVEVASARSGLAETTSGLRRVAEDSAGHWTAALEEIRRVGSAGDVKARELMQRVERVSQDSAEMKPLLSGGLLELSGRVDQVSAAIVKGDEEIDGALADIQLRVDEVGGRAAEGRQQAEVLLADIQTRCAGLKAGQEDAGRAIGDLLGEILATRTEVAGVAKKTVIACILAGGAAGLAAALLLMQVTGGG